MEKIKNFLCNIAAHKLSTDLKLTNKLIQNGVENLNNYDNSETIKKTLITIGNCIC